METLENIIEKAVALRQKLHCCPEASMNEKRTSSIIKTFIETETHHTITDRGNWFFIKIPGSSLKTPIAFRTDIDAVSGSDGIPGHFCGHDGHAATLAALAMYLNDHNPERAVYLIFQPGEEIGAGAMICRRLIDEEHIEKIFAYHNIPGRRRGSILLRQGTFACASTGMEITLTGAPSHAAYPENGKNPAKTVAELILYMNTLLQQPHKGMVLGTVIGIDAGSSAYGVSADHAILRLTLRGEYEEEFNMLVENIKNKALMKATEGGFMCSIKEIERFPATENDRSCVEEIASSARSAGLTVENLSTPFRWSEDFGAYLQLTHGAIFGIGDGEGYPQLHTREFEYPDSIMENALKVYIELAMQS